MFCVRDRAGYRVTAKARPDLGEHPKQ